MHRRVTSLLFESNRNMLNSKSLDVLEFINHGHSAPQSEEVSSNKQMRNEMLLDGDVRKLFMPMLLWNGFSAIEF